MKGFLTWHERVYRKTIILSKLEKRALRSTRHSNLCSGERRNSPSTRGDFGIQATQKNPPRKKPEKHWGSLAKYSILSCTVCRQTFAHSSQASNHCLHCGNGLRISRLEGYRPKGFGLKIRGQSLMFRTPRP